MTLVELCAGTAAVSLCALAGEPVTLCGYMGAKRRWAPRIVAALGFDTYRRPDRVVLVDAGPWGDAWRVLSSPSWRLHAQVVLRGYASEDPRELWPKLVVTPPSNSPAHRVAQFLWLQSRAAGNIPIWWDASRGEWRSPTGSKHTDADRPAALCTKGLGKSIAGKRGWGSGRRTASMLADRVSALGALPWERITVIHGDVRDVEPITGAAVYIDPPYVASPRYAAQLPRTDLLDVVRDWRAAGCRVVVSEGEPLGGEAIRLEHPRGKAEWLSCWEAASLDQAAAGRLADLLREYEVRPSRGLRRRVRAMCRAVAATIDAAEADEDDDDEPPLELPSRVAQLIANERAAGRAAPGEG